MRSGGFAPAHALVIDLEDTYCLFCSRDARRGWIHIASQHLVCTECMRDQTPTRVLSGCVLASE
jgi:hypothetical protein